MGRRAGYDERREERAPVRLPREEVLCGIGRTRANPRSTATAIVASRTHSRNALPRLRRLVRRLRKAQRNPRSAEIPPGTPELASVHSPDIAGQPGEAFGQLGGSLGTLSPASGDRKRPRNTLNLLRNAFRSLRRALRKSIREENGLVFHPPQSDLREWNHKRLFRAPPCDRAR